MVVLHLFAITGGALLKPRYYLSSDSIDTGEALQFWLESEEPPAGDYRATLLDAREFDPADWEGIRDWVNTSAEEFCSSLSPR